MKTNLLKSIFISLILVLGVSNAWAWNVEQGKVFYFKPSSAWGSDNARFAVAFGDGNNTYAWQSCTAVPGESGVYYIVSPGNYNWMILCRMKPNSTNDWSNRWNECNKVEPNNNYNKFDMKSDWGQDFNWYKYAPPMESASITNTSTVYGGNGTQGNPYQIKKGTKITVSATATSTVTADNQTKYYKFYKKENSGTRSAIGNESTTTTSSFTASNTIGTKYEVDVEARNEYYSNYSTKKATSSKLYFVTIEPIYAILGSFNNWTHSANTWDLSDQGSNNWTATFHLDKGSHTFKVVHNSSYYGKNSTTITRAFATATALSTSGANINLTTDVAGNYTFTFNSSTTNLTITYPTAYTLTYGSGVGGSGTVTADNSIKSGDLVLAGTSVSLTATPDSGYDFAAWYSDQACEGAAISSNNPYTFSINSNTTLYAKWKAQSFTLTWELDGGKITEEGTQAGSVETGTTLVAPTVEKDYYDFASWDPTVPNTMPAANVTYTAQWTPKKYAITYRDQGDKEFSGTHANGYPTTHTYNTTTTLLGATKSGYTFAGWYRDSECAGARVETLGVDVTETITLFAKWDVASYTITFDQQSGSDGTPSVTAQYGAKLSAITIPSRDGYLFDGYYTGTNGSGTKYYNADGTTTETMPHNISKLYAKWIPYSQCIFFKNNLNWNNVYVYFYSSDKYWDGDKGTGSEKEKEINGSKAHYREFRDEMTNITGTDIWYLDYKTMATNVNATYASEIDNCTNIAFTKDKQYNYEFFDNTEVVRRGDFNHDMQLFVPLLKTKQTADEKNKHDGKVTKYYSSGIWMKYNSTESGYDWRGSTNPDDANQWNKSHSFTTDNPGGYSFKASVTFDNVQTHYFKIHNNKGDWYGNGGTMDQNNCTNWTFGADNGDNAKITPTVTGTYIFTIYLGDGEVKVSLDYPLSEGDYRIVYKDSTQNSAHASHYIKKVDGPATQTESFFVRKDKEAQLFVQKCAAINSGIPTWNTVANTTININDLIPSNGIYNFVFTQNGNDVAIQYSEAYTGNYYIRTDAAPGGWDSFRQEGNKMTYSSYAEQHSNITHYFCKWVGEAHTNVKFVIANEYSHCISDTLDGDDVIDKDDVSVGCLPASANVRFGWNMETNEVTRAYISGSSNVSDRFLVLKGDENLKDLEGNNFNISGLEPHEVTFDDMGNWIYQLDVQAGRGTSIRLTARYNEQEQEFFSTSGASLIDATTPQSYKVRFIYDFKTNHLVAAWLLDDIQTSNGAELNSNMLVIRKHHDQAQQLKLNNALTNVGTAYGVMTFDKYFLNNRYSKGANIGKELPENERKSIYERALYWISFPFDVRIRDVFGFGEYMDTWIMEYYDGEARAKNGAWVDSESYWTYITDLDYVLKAGVGYVLCLDLDKMNYDSSVWAYTAEVSLYFPSAQAIGTINANQAVPVTLKQLPCSIERDNRKIYDSNWHVIGVPRFINLDLQLQKYNSIGQEDVLYYYKYNAGNNTYSVAASGGTETFQVMQAYMVQYAGTINWKGESQAPAQIAARRNADAGAEKVSFRLEIAQDEIAADKTFIQLQEEGATSDFDMNIDLTKIINAGANIYTLVGEGNVLTAGNVMPMSECVVPVGVKVDTEGEYTFRMPDGTEGMVVELIDYYTNTRTNLLLFDYTVDLSAGTCNDRFALHIQPSKSGVTTNIDQINGGSMHHEGVQKYLIDGKLIIRTAEGVFDAQGKRL